ncbi:hypothetical protein [Pseudomonas chlororaphis]|uniref:hypothetical protein n=1 Tax=Pseudomonas chlororaphis TaxID=587753 RepID=UPI0012D33F03|nr:hypothetical protein [Pseudomonas chlororaphis]
MKRDWAIWVCCVCLFAAGTIWGMVPISTEFFVVKDFHDFAEIVGAIATVIAVVLAAAGINAWRAQAVATSDHELARRVAITLQRYKFASYRAWEFTDYLVSNMKLEIGKGGVPDRFLGEVKSELKDLETINAEVHSIALECRALWGEKIWGDFQRVSWLGSQCHECITLYLRWSRVDNVERNRAAYSGVALQIFIELRKSVGKTTTEVNAYIDRVLVPIGAEVGKKLLR